MLVIAVQLGRKLFVLNRFGKAVVRLASSLRFVRVLRLASSLLFFRVLRVASLRLSALSLAKHEQKFCFFLVVLFGFASARSSFLRSANPSRALSVPFLAKPTRPLSASFLAKPHGHFTYLCCVGSFRPRFAVASARYPTRLRSVVSRASVADSGCFLVSALPPPRVGSFPFRWVPVVPGARFSFCASFLVLPCARARSRLSAPSYPRSAPAPPFFAPLFWRFRLVGAAFLGAPRAGASRSSQSAKRKHRSGVE